MKNIMELQKAELTLLQENKNRNKQLDYKKWFIENLEEFYEVDEKLSEIVAEKVQAKVKSCYQNSWKASMDRSLRYFEGLVFSHDLPIPLEHSWLVTKDNKVVDPTMGISESEKEKQMKKKYGMERKGNLTRHFGDEYVGIHIPTETLNKFCWKKKMTGDFLIDYYLQEKKK